MGYTQDVSLIFPTPKNIEMAGGNFNVTESTTILLPQSPSEHDLFLARLLVVELGNRYLQPAFMSKETTIPDNGSFILMGSTSNPLIKKFTDKNNIPNPEKLGNEGYVLKVTGNSVVVVGNTDVGVFYGFQTLRQLLKKTDGQITLPQLTIQDKPTMPFRGIRLYIPGRENITFFKRFISDFMALYKFNKIILEVNGVMRLDRHPEINVGATEFANELNYSRRGRSKGPGNKDQDSAHHDAGDGQTLEKTEVADLVAYIRKFHIEVIPEIPSLTHVYYLLNRHRELAEIKEAEWPDTYCPSNPDSYKLLFDVYDEYIDVIHPKMIHIGKDEWRMPVHVCPLCKDKDYTELFVQDVNKIYTYLNSKNVKVAMWGDHFMESVRGKGFREHETPNGEKYQVPGAITPEQVKQSIPKDILILNWFWGKQKNDLTVQNFGFKQIYGNFRPNISSWETRSKWPSVLGGAPSSWAATTELNFGKDLLYDFLGCANLLWSGNSLNHKQLSGKVRNIVPNVRYYLSGTSMPSQDDNEILPIDISASMNIEVNKSILNIKLDDLKLTGSDDFQFHIINPKSHKNLIAIGVGTDHTKTDLPEQVANIKINKDASSLIFLHACAKEAGNEKAYRQIYNFEETSDLLGWYEILYEDGYIETIPIRYGINILDVEMRRRDKDQWAEGKTGSPQNIYSYLADPIEYSGANSSTFTFFAYEWKNPRFGKVIKSVSLKASKSYKNYNKEEIPPNAIILLGLNYVEKRPAPDYSVK